MAKKKQKQKQGRGFPLLLALLCLFVAAAYRLPEVPLPGPVEEKVEELLRESRETLSAAKEGLFGELGELLALLPELGSPSASGTGNSAVGETITLETLPEYSGEPYVILYDNEPSFTEEERTAARAYEEYSPLDLLERCGVAESLVSQALMPTGERESIGMVKPSGWHTVRYDDLVEGNYLYNRCHLIGYQLTGENANERNLITGTRYLNVDGMLPFEDQVADYIEETGNRVLYRVTPDFHGLELVARGVQMEALSLEDDGEGVCFNVYCYNVQPGVEIDYLTGESWRAEEVG